MGLDVRNLRGRDDGAARFRGRERVRPPGDRVPCPFDFRTPLSSYLCTWDVDKGNVSKLKIIGSHRSLRDIKSSSTWPRLCLVRFDGQKITIRNLGLQISGIKMH